MLGPPCSNTFGVLCPNNITLLFIGLSHVKFVTDNKRVPIIVTMGGIVEMCPFRQKVIFLICTVLTILSDSQDLKHHVIKKNHTFSSL